MRTDQQWMLFDKFGSLAIQNPDVEISDLYNRFMQQIDDEDVAFVSKHFALFLRSAKDARNAPEDIKGEIVGN